MSIYTTVLLLLLISGVQCDVDDSIVGNAVLRRYYELFQTAEEAENMEKSLNAGSQITYHACCETKSKLKVYDELPNANNKTVKIVALGDMKQYFQYDTCKPVADCKCGCTCNYVDRYQPAVVFNPTNFSIEFTYVRAPTVCRCINNAPENAAPAVLDPESVPTYEIKEDL